MEFWLSWPVARGSIPGTQTSQLKSALKSVPVVERVYPVWGSRKAKPHWCKGELQLVACGGCAMVYANPVLAVMVGGEFYDAAGQDYYLSPAKLESDYAAVRFERELRLFRKYGNE